jgi:hypothetical protein
VRRLEFDAALLFAVAMPWLVFALGAGFFLLVSRALGFSRATTGGLVLTGALRLAAFAGNRSALAVGLGFKLFLVPFLMAPLYLGVLPESMHATARIAIFESAMALMIGAGIVAMQYRLNAPLVSLMLGIGIGIPLSLMTVPAWFYALGVI